MKSVSLLLLSALLFTACASKNKAVEKEIDQRAASMNVTSPEALGGTIHDAINNSKTLSAEQKQQLGDILKANKSKAEELQAQSYKYRAVLIQELLSGNVDQKKVKIMKADIKKIETERLKNTFNAIEQISAIVTSHPDNHGLTQHLIHIDGGAGGAVGR